MVTYQISGQSGCAEFYRAREISFGCWGVVYAKEVVLIKKWFPLILLVIFTVISITALSGLARNLAQKRTLFSDPLCRVVWKKKKLHRIARNLTQASDLITVKK
jgi:hypothetical protein